MKCNKTNGLDIKKLGSILAAMENYPETACFQLLGSNEWLGGGQSQSIFTSGQVKEGLTKKLIKGSDYLHYNSCKTGCSSFEYFLHALVSSMIHTMVVHATLRGISIDSIHSNFEGHIDLQGFLGLNPFIPSGFQKICVFFIISGKLSPNEKEILINLAKTLSPVGWMVEGTPILIELKNDQYEK